MTELPTIIDVDNARTRDLPHGRGVSAILFDPSTGANHVDVHLNVLNPGVRAGTVHYHRNLENVYVVLEGEGKIVDHEGREYPIRAGQAVLFKPGDMVDPHEIINTGTTKLKLVEIYAPPHPRSAYETDQRTGRDHVPVKEL